MPASPDIATTEIVAPAHAGGPTDPAHDAKLRRGVIDTQISRPLAQALVVSFVLLITLIPISQMVMEWRADEDSSLAAIFERAPTRENLRQFETELEQASYAKDYVQPRVQLGLSRWGRVGNKRALIGRDGWLYYTPGVTHVSGPSFSDHDALVRRAIAAPGADDPQARFEPDPRPAIFAMRDMLAKRGITLILFPVPDKSALQPEHLHGRASAQVPNNVGWPAFVAEMRAHGVIVFDPAPQRFAAGEPARFLVQDTHWTPRWMEQVAGELAALVKRSAVFAPPVASHTFHAVPQEVARVGDLVDMLKLPDEQTLFEPQTVTIRQVQDENGAPWEPDPAADVLLLGDSFTNVFSLDGMGWGEAAGLAPHLALALGRDLDVIAQNDSGAFATRQALARELAADEERLRGKRVVIWELASRELSVGDWKTVTWPEPVATAGERAR